MPTQSSTLYSNNITKFLLSIGDAGRFNIDLEDEVVRRSIVTHQGDVLWPAPSAAPPPTPVQSGPKPVCCPLDLRFLGSSCHVQAAIKEEKQVVEITPWRQALNTTAITSGGMATALTLGKFTGPAFMNLTTTLGLAGLVGFRAVWNVAPALHSPLMCRWPRCRDSGKAGLMCRVAVTNALSGLVGVGGLFVMGGGLIPHTLPQWLGAASVFLANLSMFRKICAADESVPDPDVDIFGGFLITKRMLDLFRRATDPPEYGWLYAVPAVVFGGGFAWAASTGLGGLVAAGYFVSTMLSIGALTGLSSQASLALTTDAIIQLTLP